MSLRAKISASKPLGYVRFQLFRLRSRLRKPIGSRRIANRFEWRFTPKHAGWLDMAEIEIGVMSGQALAEPLPDMESFKSQVKSWTLRRGAARSKADWQFTAKDARIKLKRLYPIIR
jgi:hypothetical protein